MALAEALSGGGGCGMWRGVTAGGLRRLSQRQNGGAALILVSSRMSTSSSGLSVSALCSMWRGTMAARGVSVALHVSAANAYLVAAMSWLANGGRPW